MLAPEIGSTNDGPISVVAETPGGTPVVVTAMNEKAPLITRRHFFSRITNVFRNRSQPSQSLGSGGYVEFGAASDVEPGRTLGTFAGVFSPVALSMFSALLFLRVDAMVYSAWIFRWRMSQSSDKSTSESHGCSVVKLNPRIG